jgi:CheY-like chemotaxis protein
MPRIIVLDDDPAVLHVVEDVLQDVGWDVTCCRDSDGIVDALQVSSPDVFLIDIHLRDGETGWDIVERLKTDSDTAAIPVIVSSGDRYGLQNHMPLIEKQAAAVLVKPFGADDLYHCVDHALGEPRSTIATS